MKTETPITLTNLTLGYDRHPAVHHITGTFTTGSLTALVGPNGAGKSTLIKALAGVLMPIDGQCMIDPSLRRAYLPQLTEIDRFFPISVYDFVAMGLWSKSGALHALPAFGAHRITDALALVGLNGFDHHLIGALSGGQFQRALFARLMLQDASIILIDEPFSAIDSATVDDLMQLVMRWHHEGRTIITVLHDLALVRHYFPKTLLLARDVIGWDDTHSVLTEDNLKIARQKIEAPDPHAPLCEHDA
jgi:zinc/manganese transport system ATP-binding protein